MDMGIDIHRCRIRYDTYRSDIDRRNGIPSRRQMARGGWGNGAFDDVGTLGIMIRGYLWNDIGESRQDRVIFRQAASGAGATTVWCGGAWCSARCAVYICTYVRTERCAAV